MSSEPKGPWEATAVQNLVRYRPAGTYFARFRVNGKRVWKSLETTVFSVAKQRLPETMREHRGTERPAGTDFAGFEPVIDTLFERTV